MSFSEELRQVRQRCFLSQEAFARELNVSFSTVNRWECGHAKPNLSTMKKIKEFCVANNIDSASLEEKWLVLISED